MRLMLRRSRRKVQLMSGISLTVLEHLRESNPKGLIALAGTGALMTYLDSTSKGIERMVDQLEGTQHPVFMHQKYDRNEAMREVLMQALPMEDNEASKKDQAEADRIAKVFRAKLTGSDD